MRRNSLVDLSDSKQDSNKSSSTGKLGKYSSQPSLSMSPRQSPRGKVAVTHKQSPRVSPRTGSGFSMMPPSSKRSSVEPAMNDILRIVLPNTDQLQQVHVLNRDLFFSNAGFQLI